MCRSAQPVPHQNRLEPERNRTQLELRSNKLGVRRSENVGACGFCQNAVLLAPVSDLQGSHVVHQVPGLVRRELVGVGPHGASIHPGHEGAVKIAVCDAALESVGDGEVVRGERFVLDIDQRRGIRPVAMAFGSMAPCAFELL
jgi:hypothetical protein